MNVQVSLTEVSVKSRWKSSNTVIEWKLITATEGAYLSENGDLSSTNEKNQNEMLSHISGCYWLRKLCQKNVVLVGVQEVIQLRDSQQCSVVFKGQYAFTWVMNTKMMTGIGILIIFFAIELKRIAKNRSDIR